ncbi:hypothetical protein ACEUZ9_002699 [Paracoccus litorisediminis]|uniref:hypothetical protein n=1 Tax=Paracoccus litorisediminis TaxID=2006130 RepID=UPI003734201E
MKPTTIYFGILGSIVIGGSVALAALHREPEVEFISACEDVLKERLKAPATYRRIEVSKVRTFQGSYDQLEGYDLVPDRKARDAARDRVWIELDEQRRKLFEQDPAMMEVLITSEAQNSFGVPVRAVSLCRDSAWTKDTNAKLKSPQVNGYDAMDWALRGL